MNTTLARGAAINGASINEAAKNGCFSNTFKMTHLDICVLVRSACATAEPCEAGAV